MYINLYVLSTHWLVKTRSSHWGAPQNRQTRNSPFSLLGLVAPILGGKNTFPIKGEKGLHKKKKKKIHGAILHENLKSVSKKKTPLSKAPNFHILFSQKTVNPQLHQQKNFQSGHQVSFRI